jgi:type II secretory pathway pseudopilin PulG
MDLERQGEERGYAMAALLVSLAVMSVLLSVILPAWHHEVQREKEAELVFRGEQVRGRSRVPRQERQCVSRASMSSCRAGLL